MDALLEALSEGNESVRTTHVALVLDRSGSMEVNLAETLSGFNEQIDALRAMQSDTQDIRVTFTTFATNVETHYVDRPVGEVEYLTKETYVPSGWTAMYDGVGQTIVALEDQVSLGEDDAFWVQVFSDGQENRSQEYTSPSLAAVVNRLQETGDWTFTYMGSNQDLGRIREALNLKTGNVCSYSADEVGGTKMAFAAWASSTSKYFRARESGLKNSDYLYGDSDEEIATAESVVGQAGECCGTVTSTAVHVQSLV